MTDKSTDKTEQALEMMSEFADGLEALTRASGFMVGGEYATLLVTR